MNLSTYTPHHINATPEDFIGNNGIGRYVFLPGSDGRAKEISRYFDDLVIKEHARGHHLYLGVIKNGQSKIDVAVISSGMGCPSLEIILHELFHLGAKRFLRVGTAGSLQQQTIKIGDLVNAQASVRDETTTTDYVPIAVPAIASYEFVSAITASAKKINPAKEIATGLVHCKSSFYAREFGVGPNHVSNKAYLNLLTQCGVLASEMETATLFIQSQLYNHQLSEQGQGPAYRVLAGAVLGILAMPPQHFANATESAATAERLIKVALETIRILAKMENSDRP